MRKITHLLWLLDKLKRTGAPPKWVERVEARLDEAIVAFIWPGSM